MRRKPHEKQKLPQTEVKIAFEKETVDLSLDQIAAVRVVPPAQLKGRTFQKILASIREAGIVELPIVYPDKGSKDKYILLEGHLRIAALKELGKSRVTCLVSTDDETYTLPGIAPIFCRPSKKLPK
ncbi:MAG: ParB/RepB/Spo0J family partition protein [Proteobacteria bacterium]|nr:ParB/RepB/Spo0J family partition protein [Pseudomonadota bacterium]